MANILCRPQLGGIVDPVEFSEKSSNPDQPSEGKCVAWLSNGTGYGDDGDLMAMGAAGGVTKYSVIFDHSAGTPVFVSQIDTANKRRAASGYFLFLLPPIPDGDIDTADDRYHNAGFY